MEKFTRISASRASAQRPTPAPWPRRHWRPRDSQEKQEVQQLVEEEGEERQEAQEEVHGEVKRWRCRDRRALTPHLPALTPPAPRCTTLCGVF